jgi:hypothetical protein
MTQPAESVITPERFQQGLTWQQWLEQVETNRDRFLDNYEATVIDRKEVETIKTMMAMPRGPYVWGVSRHGPGKVLALVEDWCADCYRGLPVMARLCEATGMELRIFSRDQNLDIADEVLYRDEFHSVPTFVFYSKEHEYLGHWIERPDRARDEYAAFEDLEARANEPGLVDDERQRRQDELREFERGPTWDEWRREQITETRELLQAGLYRAGELEALRDRALFD